MSVSKVARNRNVGLETISRSDCLSNRSNSPLDMYFDPFHLTISRYLLTLTSVKNVVFTLLFIYFRENKRKKTDRVVSLFSLLFTFGRLRW
jgi:hypothetical protein